MEDNIRKKLNKLASDILQYENKNISKLHEISKEIYENLTVLKYMENNKKATAVVEDIHKMGDRFEKMVHTVLGDSVPESNPNKEDIITSGIDTIKNIVAEMPTEQKEILSIDNQFFNADLKFIKKNNVALDQVIKSQGIVTTKSLNDRLSSKIVVGLNDRLAFVKHLFNENISEFNNTIAKLNNTSSLEKAMDFIQYKVKPTYNYWEGKEEYEKRFIQIISQKFA